MGAVAGGVAHELPGQQAALLEQFHAAVAWRHRQPDLNGEVLHGDAAVGLKNRQDLAVDGVEESALHPAQPPLVLVLNQFQGALDRRQRRL